MKLINPTDSELDAAFAEKVAGLVLCDCGGWTHLIAGASMMRINDKCEKNCCPSFPYFTKSFDAVLPCLQREGWDWEHRFSGPISMGSVIETIAVYGPDSKAEYGKHDYTQGTCTPAKAACIALLRAHGVEVEFTK